MPELRDYQQTQLDQIKARLQTPNARVMMQLPTGGGKTHTAGTLLSEWLVDGRKAVWLTHREHLAYQTKEMLESSRVSASVERGWISGSPVPARNRGVVILMAQTVSRRNHNPGTWRNFNRNDLLIIDEAHHATAEGWLRAIDQWPGPALGMTATPWRMSKQEGFNHLFSELLVGPQISELQSGKYLCQAQVIMPSEKDRIRGGTVSPTTLDFTEPDIERTNHPDIMTAGAFQFWKEHSQDRPTIIYAVSRGHAHNLVAVFNDAGVSANTILSDTPAYERLQTIRAFEDGRLKALINVAVATEGFDLPDASCVMIARPTLSLALYLQMVGRGLRPKKDGGNCVILDLAGNSLIHGLPERNRRWSLAPRGEESQGDAPVVWCDNCGGVSPAASHFCQNCNMPLGKDCGRCGKWRVTDRWSLADRCTHQHDVVCDLCHLDAHVAANLPVSREIEEAGIDPLLFALVDVVRKDLLGDDTRQNELDKLIERRNQENSNTDEMDRLFDEHIKKLPDEEHPTSSRMIALAFNSWEAQRQEQLDAWKEELINLKSKTVSEHQVRRGCHEQLKQAQDKLIQLKNRLRDKPVNENFLFTALLNEEKERLPDDVRAQVAELGRRLDNFQQDAKNEEQFIRSTARYRALHRKAYEACYPRLLKIAAQFVKRWTEIWSDYRQLPE